MFICSLSSKNYKTFFLSSIIAIFVSSYSLQSSTNQNSHSHHFGKRASAQQNSFTVRPGWNLLSLPVNVTNGNKTLLFPNALSQAYIFDSQNGYQSKDTLTHGIGFWLKFGISETLSVTGNAVFKDSIEVEEGWNIIGTVAQPLAVNSITTNPEGIITSPFFTFVPGAGYQQTDTLQPGLGYWVKTNQRGTIIPIWKGIVFNDSTLLPEELPNFQSVDVDSNQLTFTFTTAEDLPTIFPGQMLFGISDSGYTRKVVGYSTNGNQLIVQTSQARLDEVFDYADIDTTITLAYPDSVELHRLLSEPLDYEQIINGERYNVTSSKPEIHISSIDGALTLNLPNFAIEATITSTFQFSASASMLTISIPVPTFTCDVHINQNNLDNAKFYFTVSPSFQMSDLKLSAAGVKDSTLKVELVGPLPLGRIVSPYVLGMIEIGLTLYAGFQGQIVAAGQMKSTGNVNVVASMTAGVEFNGGCVPIWNPNITATTEGKFKAAGQFSTTVKPFIQPSLEFEWNRIATVGVFGRAFGYVDVTAPPFVIETGMGVSGGVETKLELLFSNQELFNTTITLAEQKWPLWSTRGPDEPKNPVPTNNSTDVKDTVTLRWTGSHPDNNSLFYDVYFGTENPPQTLVATNLTDVFFFADNLLENTDYFWKIEAREEDGDTTVSPVWKFTTQPAPQVPVLISPTDGAIMNVSTVLFIWNGSENATSYTVQVSTDNLFNNLIVEQIGIVDTNKSVSSLEEGMTYFWRVRASNSFGVSDWSVARSFTMDYTTPPPTPPLSFYGPTEGFTNSPLVTGILWGKTPRTTHHTLQISSNSTFSSVDFEYYVVQESWGTLVMLDELDGSTTYYWRVKAHNPIGESDWSVVHSFSTIIVSSSCGTVLHEGKLLSTTRIGDQCWMTQNLNVGTMIQDTSTPTNNGTIEKYCYNNNPTNCNTYGGLYTWDEAMEYSTSEVATGICPSGWHIPTKAELTTLSENYVAGNRKPLLQIGQSDGTNKSGFSALLGGRFYASVFEYIDAWSFNWSSTIYSTTSRNVMYIRGDIPNGAAGVSATWKMAGIAVRCIKN
jgi:uncharacterized protein (TIGR02145 family)